MWRGFDCHNSLTLDRRRGVSIRTAGATGAGLRWSRRGLARLESGYDVFDVGLER